MNDNKKPPAKATALCLADRTSEIRDCLEQITEYWNGKTQINISYALLVRALVKRYAKLLQEDEPNRLDLDKIF